MSEFGTINEGYAPPPPVKTSRAWIWWVVGILGACILLACLAALIGGIVLYTQGNLPFFSRLDYNAPALSGEGTLSSGFLPDPYTVVINGGGSIDAAATNVGDGCIGFISTEPSYSLNWTRIGGAGGQIRIFFVDGAANDTTMVVRDPNGVYFCNDDSGYGGFDPLVDLSDMPTGQYDIWIGSYSSDVTTNGTLYVTELDYTPVSLPGSGLNISGNATYGGTSLQAGFSPDPYETSLSGGGDVDVRGQHIGTNCIGYAASDPDFRLNWSGSSAELTVYFNASQDSADTTLIILTPNGNWYCNDDGVYGLNPAVTIPNPAAGEYTIWIGRYSAGSPVPGVLGFTEIGLSDQGGGGGSGSSLDPGMTPNYGEIQLSAGFSNDPHEITVTSGGEVDVWSQNLGQGCLGHTTIAPDYRLYWSGSTNRLRIFFNANSGDTTLVIQTPSGNWLCNDDGPTSYDPLIDISHPASGQYNIWVGSYSDGAFHSGTLVITERDLVP